MTTGVWHGMVDDDDRAGRCSGSRRRCHVEAAGAVGMRHAGLVVLDEGRPAPGLWPARRHRPGAGGAGPLCRRQHAVEWVSIAPGLDRQARQPSTGSFIAKLVPPPASRAAAIVGTSSGGPCKFISTVLLGCREGRTNAV